MLVELLNNVYLHGIENDQEHLIYDRRHIQILQNNRFTKTYAFYIIISSFFNRHRSEFGKKHKPFSVYIKIFKRLNVY